MKPVVPFRVESLFLALPLERVVRVLRMVALTALPQAPRIVRGVIDIQGQVVSVVDLRRRFDLPERPPGLSDQLLLAESPQRRVALIVDSVEVVRHYAEEDFATAADGAACLVRGGDGLLVIHDLDAFLSAREAQELGALLVGAP